MDETFCFCFGRNIQLRVKVKAICDNNMKKKQQKLARNNDFDRT